MSGTDFSEYLKQVAAGVALSEAEAQAAFDLIMSGSVSEVQIAAFLSILAWRGAAVEEVTGAAQAMRAKMLTIKAPEGAIDLCGTGGDGHGTLNISTAVTFVAAAAGVPVAKHGNRGASSRAGAADVLETLGARIDLAPEAAEKCLAQTGLCFLFAQVYHPAMKYVAPVRKQLGFRTIFNVLGPLCSPARVKRQLLGVFAPEWTKSLPKVLLALGSERALVVHGKDGLDELTTTDATVYGKVEGYYSGGIVTFGEFDAERDAGLPRATLAALKGGDAAENAAALRRLFEGEQGAYRDIVLLNASAALIVAGRTNELRAGVALAQDVLDSGGAKRKLDEFIDITRAA